MESRINIQMTDELEAYLDRFAYREHPVLARCREEAVSRGAMAVMQVAPDQGAFLAFLVRLIGARRVLEFGTFTGYSSMAMALALPDDGRIVTCDVSEELVEIAKGFWAEAGLTDKITLLLGNARSTTVALESGSFDLVFIDADKPSYLDYYERAIDLVKPGGLIVIDDTLARGLLLTGKGPQYSDYINDSIEVIGKLNEFIRNDERVDMVLIPWRDGITLARKRES